jgi:hypothetical protein
MGEILMKKIILCITLLFPLGIKAGEIDISPLKSAYNDILAFCDKHNYTSTQSYNLDLLSLFNGERLERDVRMEELARKLDLRGTMHVAALSTTCFAAILYTNGIESRILDILLGAGVEESREWISITLNYKRLYVELAIKFRERAYPEFLNTAKSKFNEINAKIFCNAGILLPHLSKSEGIERLCLDYMSYMITQAKRLENFAFKKGQDAMAKESAIELAAMLSREVIVVGNILERHLIEFSPSNKELLALVTSLQQEAIAACLYLRKVAPEGLFGPPKEGRK